MLRVATSLRADEGRGWRAKTKRVPRDWYAAAVNQPGRCARKAEESASQRSASRGSACVNPPGWRATRRDALAFPSWREGRPCYPPGTKSGTVRAARFGATARERGQQRFLARHEMAAAAATSWHGSARPLKSARARGLAQQPARGWSGAVRAAQGRGQAMMAADMTRRQSTGAGGAADGVGARLTEREEPGRL